MAQKTAEEQPEETAKTTSDHRRLQQLDLR
jgi:hypothetical protein